MPTALAELHCDANAAICAAGMSDATTSVSNRDVARGAGTTLIARLGGVLDVVTQPLYVLLFGLTGYGFYGSLWAAITLIENVADLGMASALQRVIPQAKSPEEEAACLRAAFLVGVVPNLVIAAIVSLLAAPTARLFNVAPGDERIAVEAVRLFAWAIPLWAFLEIATSALRAKRVFGAEIRLRLFWEQVMRLAFVSALYFAHLGTSALIIGHLMSLFAICLLCIRLMRQYFDVGLIVRGGAGGEAFSETVRAAFGVWPVNIVTRLFMDGPTLLLNFMLPGASGATASALFIIARKISSLVQLVRTAFAYVLAPLASAASAGDDGSLKSIYGFVTRLSVAIAVPLGMVLGASGPVALRLFGADAAAALVPLVLMTVARVFEAICGAATPIQQVTSRHLDQQLGSLIGLGVAGTIAWFGVAEYGVTAMAAAVGMGLIIAAIIPLFQLHLIDRLHPFSAPFASVAVRTTGISLCGGAVTLAVPHLPELVQLPVAIAILLTTIWCALRFALPPEDHLALGEKTARALRLAAVLRD